MNAMLALEDGTVFRGTSAGAPGEARGEVVFNTSMTGYQEVLTDPSYAGQIVTMTSAQIGNYGVSREDTESAKPQVAGFVMRESSPVASNWRADQTLREYLTPRTTSSRSPISTRVRSPASCARAASCAGHRDRQRADTQQLVERARSIAQMEGADLVRDVTCDSAVRVARRRR